MDMVDIAAGYYIRAPAVPVLVCDRGYASSARSGNRERGKGARAAKTRQARRLVAQPIAIEDGAMPIGELCRYASAAAMPIHAAMPAMLQSPRSITPSLSRSRAEGQSVWAEARRLRGGQIEAELTTVPHGSVNSRLIALRGSPP
jgi:hypothetical protein